MYPILGRISGQGSQPQPASTSYSNAAGGRYPQPSGPTGSQNGPTLLPSSSFHASGAANFPMLRVHIADEYRTFPPVMINAGLEDIQRTQFTYDFDYERQLISRLQAEQGQSEGPTTTASQARRKDPLQPLVDRFLEMGYARDEVSLALATIGGDANVAQEEQVIEFCKSYRELKSMGFDTACIVGSLVMHKGDLTAATEACLAVHAG